MAKLNQLVSITTPAEDATIVVTDTVSSKKITVADLRSAVTRTASANVRGTVKVGSGLRIDDTGTLSVLNFSGYVLPPATKTSLGGVVVGSGLTIDQNGVLNVNSLQIPRASTTVFGVVRIGSGLNINDGVLSSDANNYVLPTATQEVLGGIKVGRGLEISQAVLSVRKPAVLEGNLTIVENFTTENNSNSYSIDSATIDKSVTFTVERNSSWVIYSPVSPSVAGSSSAIQESASVITQDYEITDGRTATSYGPITVSSTATVLIPPLSTWIIF